MALYSYRAAGYQSRLRWVYGPLAATADVVQAAPAKRRRHRTGGPNQMRRGAPWHPWGGTSFFAWGGCRAGTGRFRRNQISLRRAQGQMPLAAF